MYQSINGTNYCKEMKPNILKTYITAGTKKLMEGNIYYDLFFNFHSKIVQEKIL